MRGVHVYTVTSLERKGVPMYALHRYGEKGSVDVCTSSVWRFQGVHLHVVTSMASSLGECTYMQYAAMEGRGSAHIKMAFLVKI